MTKHLIFSPPSLLHITPPGHPESVYRYQILEKVFKSLPSQTGRLATPDEIALCHNPLYIELVQREIANHLPTLSTGDVELSPGSWEGALSSAGSVLTAVDLIHEEGQAFVITRPPGHHACSSQGMGFCLFNNVAIGARYAQKKYGFHKILIVDWDLHHGNGTEEIFLNDPSVFYFSTHESPLYPGTGLSSRDHIVNVPILAGPNSRVQIFDAFNKQLIPLMEIFKPELVFISAGFDAHYLDPLGHLDLRSEDFAELTRFVKKIANAYSKGRIVSVLEGGYHLQALAESAVHHYKEI